MMSTNLAKKKKIRGGHRGYVTKTLGMTNDLLENFDPSLETKVKQQKITLEESLITLKTLDEQILDLVDEDEGITGENRRGGKFPTEDPRGFVENRDDFEPKQKHDSRNSKRTESRSNSSPA